MFNKNIKIVLQIAICHLCERTLVPFLGNYRGPNATASMEGYRENRQSTSYNFNFLQYYVQFRVLLDVTRDH